MREHPLWLGERFTRGQAWVDLLLAAAHAEHTVIIGGRLITIHRGEVLTSQVRLAQRWQWDRETVRHFLVQLGALGMTTIETSKSTDTGFTRVTLLNFEAYQGNGTPPPGIESRIETSIDPPSDPASMPHSEEGRRSSRMKRRGEASPPSPRARIRFDGASITGVLPEDLERWRKLAPAVDLDREIEKAALYLTNHPERRRSNVAQFLANWVTRAQDDLARRRPPAGTGGARRINDAWKSQPAGDVKL